MAGPPQNDAIQPPLTADEQIVREYLRQHVSALAGDIGIRHDSNPASLDAAMGYLLDQWGQLEQTVNVESYPTSACEAKNLVVEWRGRAKPERVVIVGAHYDTVRYTPGADDNASAVAMMLAVCRALKERAFGCTLRFVAFANEEPPHFTGPTMGSRVYAKGCKSRGEDIHAMVCLEMVGYFDTSEHTQQVPEELSEAVAELGTTSGDFIAFVADAATLERLDEFTTAFNETVDFPALAVPDVHRQMWLSDHGPFWDEDYPALMVTDTSFFRNPNYHEMSDTPDTLDYDRMARVAVGIAAGVAKLAAVR